MAEIILQTGEVTYVDDEDLELVNQTCKIWYVYKSVSGNIYARGGDGRGQIFLHWLITGYKHVDHIDNDGLNNRRSNLRPATTSQNAMNRKKTSKPSSSQYKGVSWNKSNKKWMATIMLNGKYKHLGYFKDEVEAAKAYDEAALKLFGEFSLLNFPAPGGRLGYPVG